VKARLNIAAHATSAPDHANTRPTGVTRIMRAAYRSQRIAPKLDQDIWQAPITERLG